jgi:hypothetical protein
VLIPPDRDAVTGEFAGVVAGLQVDKALVPAHVVETVRDHHARSRTSKIVIVCLDGFLRVDLAVMVEIAQQFLLLRVHTNDWQAGPQILVLETGDVLELGVAIRIAGTHRLLFQCLSPAVPVFAEQLGYDVAD